MKRDHSRPEKNIIGKREGEERKKQLKIVLKCDSVGSLEAVVSALKNMQIRHVEVVPIHQGVGSISKSDLLMALTGSRLVVGFNVDLLPKITQLSKERGIEVRLYEVIYKLTEDIVEIASSLVRREVEEKITGKGEVIALFKSSRRGIILGCKVMAGTLRVGKDFRLISAMGPVYSGRIESLHIEKDEVKEAKVGQQVGIKISDFKRAKVGDLVETYEKERTEENASWHPKGRVFMVS